METGVPLQIEYLGLENGKGQLTGGLLEAFPAAQLEGCLVH